MTILLAGDIGGTKTILRLVKAEPSESLKPLPLLTTLYEDSYSSQAYSDLIPIVIEFLDSAEKSLGQKYSPEKGCFGIAGPVVNNTCNLTNLSWFLDANTLEQELNLSRVKLINDFAAIGYGVVGLTEDDLHTLQAGEPDATAPIGVIGAGTGLGEGFVIPTVNGYSVFSTEGGHVDFAPRSELEFQLLSYVRELQNITRVSAERIISGMGIAAIYQFLRDHNSSLETPQMTEVFKKWKQEIGHTEKTIDLGAEVSKAAAMGEDYLCEQTMQMFVDAYGTEAGNLALKLLPYGGLYIAGGIAAKNLALMEKGIFMKAFTSKGRISPLMEKVPVYIVLNPKVGLIGAALCAAQLT
ncbi:glucokinase [Lyngbya aestuarii BL J]|uniref:Glucokinase n=1 Tax=Lyngbya aestuarii BL J TaxID=1348334 RepID=U7QCR9_9CYAN|nr:glucokinase [Lyngbya aestuarii]ERT05633.1 glucokinase [Lyngbya aestuarii BL J]